MKSNFLPLVEAGKLNAAQISPDKEAYFDLLAQPLHEELYKRQDFNFLDELSVGQQLLLSYDYIRQQVLQGGFIQLIQNGYIGLLPQMPDWLYKIGADGMAQVIDDVLKVYVLNNESLERKTSVEEFARLYDEFKEFEGIDDRFVEENEKTRDLILSYATHHIEEFATIDTAS